MRSASHWAEDKKEGMTLEELAAFVQDCLRIDIDPRTRIKAQIGFGSQLQRVETK